MNRGTLILVLAATTFASGCATQAPYSSGQYDRGYGGDPYYRNSGYDDRNYRGYDSYPASRSANAPAPSPGIGSYLPQAAGAVAGGLLGAQVGKGNGRVAASAAGAASGAYVAGRMADPCQPSLNLGHLIGGLAGGLLGAQVGGGNGRTAAAAVGAAAGTTVGGNMGGTSSCR